MRSGLCPVCDSKPQEGFERGDEGDMVQSVNFKTRAGGGVGSRLPGCSGEPCSCCCAYVGQTCLDLDGCEEKGDVFERISEILGRSNGRAWVPHGSGWGDWAPQCRAPKWEGR